MKQSGAQIAEEMDVSDDEIIRMISFLDKYMNREPGSSQLKLHCILFDDSDGLHMEYYYTREEMEHAYACYVREARGDAPVTDDFNTLHDWVCENGLQDLDSCNPIGEIDVDLHRMGVSIIPAGDFPDGEDYEFLTDTPDEAHSCWLKIGDKVLYIVAREPENHIFVEMLTAGKEEEVEPDGWLGGALHCE